jgi:hypothetical protein
MGIFVEHTRVFSCNIPGTSEIKLKREEAILPHACLIQYE